MKLKNTLGLVMASLIRQPVAQPTSLDIKGNELIVGGAVITRLGSRCKAYIYERVQKCWVAK